MHTDEGGVEDNEDGEGLLRDGGEERLLLIRPILLLVVVVYLLRVGFLSVVVVGVDTLSDVVDYT